MQPTRSIFTELIGEYVEIIGKTDIALIYQPMTHIDHSRKKITVTKDIIVDEYLNYDIEIDDFIERLTGLRENGATHINFNSEYDSSSVTLSADLKREETDDEYNLRIQKVEWVEKQEREKAEAKERYEFERLKKKFA